MADAFSVRNLAASAAVSAASRTNRLQADHVQLPKHLAPPVSRQHWFFSLHSLRPSPGTGCVCARCSREERKSWRPAVGGRADCPKTHDARRASRFSSRLVSVSSVSATDGLRGAGLVHLPTSGVVGPWRSGCALNAGPF